MLFANMNAAAPPAATPVLHSLPNQYNQMPMTQGTLICNRAAHALGVFTGGAVGMECLCDALPGNQQVRAIHVGQSSERDVNCKATHAPQRKQSA